MNGGIEAPGTGASFNPNVRTGGGQSMNGGIEAPGTGASFGPNVRTGGGQPSGAVTQRMERDGRIVTTPIQGLDPSDPNYVQQRANNPGNSWKWLGLGSDDQHQVEVRNKERMGWDEFQNKYKGQIDPNTGKVLGPQSGANYQFEGMGARELYDRSYGAGSEVGYGDMEWNPNHGGEGGGMFGGISRDFLTPDKLKMYAAVAGWGGLGAMTAAGEAAGAAGAAEAAAGASPYAAEAGSADAFAQAAAGGAPGASNGAGTLLNGAERIGTGWGSIAKDAFKTIAGGAVRNALNPNQQNAINAADPFSSQRAQYQQPLQQMMTGNFTPEDPSYKWRMDQGMEAINRGAAASGMLNSGNRLLALQDYGQKSASQEYQNQYSRLAQLSGATAGVGNAGQIAQQQNASQSGAAGAVTDKLLGWAENLYGNWNGSSGSEAGSADDFARKAAGNVLDWF